VEKPIEPRNAAQLSEPLNRCLSQYALAAGAAGVGLLALAQPTEAKVVYTKTHQLLHGLRHSLDLDLNNDGRSDFRLAIEVAVGSYGAGFLAVFPLSNSVRVNSKGAAAYPAGVRIGPKDRYYRPPKTIYGTLMEYGCFYKSRCRSDGNWLKVENQYLGLAFVIDGKTHYGWARISATTVPPYNHPSARLTGYAYETIPNKPIITGKTKGPDVITVKPGSLGALAAGRK
jgi:hypothetical protein